METIEQIPWPFVITVLVLGVVAAIIWVWIWRRLLPIGHREIASISCFEAGKSSALRDTEFEVSAPKSQILFNRVVSTVPLVIFVACLFEPFWYFAIVGVPLFGFVAVNSWRSNWVEVSANVEGIQVKTIFGTFSADWGRKKFILWSEIASCEVVTTHNVYGKFIRRYPVLKDAEGRFVFNGSSSKASQEDLDRLINFIQGK
jgi:hypothetical protein